MEKQFIAILTKEAENQLIELPDEFKERIAEAIKTFEYVGTYYKNLNNLGDGLFEIKPKGVRAYFMYDKVLRKVIIIGFICLKKTQKAPKQYIKQARINIKKYIEQRQEVNNE